MSGAPSISTTSGRPNPRSITLGVLGVFLAGQVFATAMILCARLGWFAELFTHFRVQGAVSGGLFAALFLALRAPRRAILSALLGLGHVMAIAPDVFPILASSGVGATVEGLPRFRLLSANLLTENTEHAAFLAIVRAEKPDVVQLLEVGDDWADALSTLADEYPVRTFGVRDDNFGVAALLRDPRAKAAIISCGPAGVPSTLVELPLGVGVTILSTHPIPPIRPGAAAERNAQLADCARELAAAPGAHILAGDFNVTPWSPVFADLLTQTGLTDSRRGFGLQPSWLVEFPPLSLPIDHVLHGPELMVLDRRIGPDFGSDHRPVIVDFALL